MARFQRTTDELQAATEIAARAATLAIDPDVGVARLADVIDAACASGEVERLHVGLQAIVAPEIAAAPLAHALGAHVTLLAAIAGIRQAVVWRLDDEDGLVLAACTGHSGRPAYRTRDAAFRALRGHLGGTARRVDAFGAPVAVLGWEETGGDPALAGVLAARSAAHLGLVFERAALLDGTVAQHAAIARTAERRLSRVAFDLHDGPMQDLALLCAELHRVRGALGATTGTTAGVNPRTLIDDVLAIAESTASELRELATSVEPSSLLQRPFADALGNIVRAFGLRTEIEPSLVIEGDPGDLLDAERVTLLRVIGEALANVRAHSGAAHVDVCVTVSAGRVEAAIVDDGAGFDVETMLPAAARAGRLGLLGMIERVRIVEGHCDVRSLPGQGTTVALWIDRTAAAAVAATERPRAPRSDAGVLAAA